MTEREKWERFAAALGLRIKDPNMLHNPGSAWAPTMGEDARDRILALLDEITGAWRALGESGPAGDEDPDVATLAQAIEVSLQYERDLRAQITEQRDEARQTADDNAYRAGAALAERDTLRAELAEWETGMRRPLK